MSPSFTTRVQSLFGSTNRRSFVEWDEPGHKGFVITFCFLAASVLWFAFSMQETHTQIIDLRTEIVNLAQDQAFTSLPPEVIRVQVEGEGVQILRLYYNPPVIQIDASLQEVDLMMVVPEVVKNVSLQTVIPRIVSIAVEKRVTKKVAVVPQVTIQLGQGFRMIGEIQTVPDSVTVSGAQSVVSSITEWKTMARDIGVLSDSLNAVIALSDSLGRLLDLDVREVLVKADIQEFTEARRVLEVRAVGMPRGESVSFSPPTVKVVYHVSLSQFDASLKSDDFYVFVPYADINRDQSGLIYPMVHAPSDMDIREPRITPLGLRYYEIQND